MKAIIHIGMSKTGSSSIQQTFARVTNRQFTENPPNILYPGGGGNHSFLTALLFMKDPLRNPGFKARGLTADDIEVMKKEKKAELISQMKASNAETFVMSSELLSSFTAGRVKKMKMFMDRHFEDTQILAYVRPPVGYMTSVFQQRLKGNLTDLELVWPKYRKCFESMDEVFGKENVHLKVFDRKTLYKGDVVADCAKFIGFELEPDQIINKNESLSLEATALLYIQRKYGGGFKAGSPEAVSENYKFTDFLRTIKGEKLRFSDKLLKPILDENREDLDWIEERLGMSILDSIPEEGRLISEEDDLVKIAWETTDSFYDEFEDIKRFNRNRNMKSLVKYVEILYRSSLET